MGEVAKGPGEDPGITFCLSQPIDMRVQEMIIGARGDVVIKGARRGHRRAEPNRSRRRRDLREVPGSADVLRCATRA